MLEVVAYDHKYVIAEGVATVNRLIAKDGCEVHSVLECSVVRLPRRRSTRRGS